MRYLLYLERCSPSSIRISCDTRPLLSCKAERTGGSGELYCVRSLELGDPRAKWPTCSSISKRVREIHARASEPGWYIGLILVRDPEGYQISWIDHMVLGWSHFLASRSSSTGLQPSEIQERLLLTPPPPAAAAGAPAQIDK